MIGDRSDARSGDQALWTLYSEYDDAVRGFITKQFTQDTGLIDEVVQDTFVEVWKFPERYNDEYAFKTWLLGIARHKAIDALRQVSATGEPIEKLVDTLPAAAPDVTEVIYHDQVNRLLKSGLTKLVENGKLSAEHREVLQLMYVEDLNVTEMAAIIRCPENTVKTRLHYARERVRSYFETCLTGFIFHGEAVKLGGSAKIDQAIDHTDGHYPPLDSAAKPQNTVTGSDHDHALVCCGLLPASIPKAAGRDFQADPTGKPPSDLALLNHFQDFGCQAAGGHDAKLAVLPAQNGQPTADLAAAVGGAVTFTDWTQTLGFLVSAGGNASLDGGAAKTAGGEAAGTSSGASQTSVDGGGIKTGTPIAPFPGGNAGLASLNGHSHHDGLGSPVNQSADHATEITTGGTERQLSPSVSIFSGCTGDCQGHNDAYNHLEIANNSPMSGADAIQLVGLAHEPADILSGHHLIF